MPLWPIVSTATELVFHCFFSYQLVTAKITVTTWCLVSPWHFSPPFQFLLSFAFDITVVQTAIRALPGKDPSKTMEVSVRSVCYPMGFLTFLFLPFSFSIIIVLSHPFEGTFFDDLFQSRKHFCNMKSSKTSSFCSATHPTKSRMRIPINCDPSKGFVHTTLPWASNLISPPTTGVLSVIRHHREVRGLMHANSKASCQGHHLPSKRNLSCGRRRPHLGCCVPWPFFSLCF